MKNKCKWRTTVLFRSVCTLILQLLLVYSNSVEAANQPNKVSLPKQVISFKRLISHIEQQTNYSFVVSSEAVDRIGVVEFNSKEADAKELLEVALHETAYSYELKNNIVVIRKRAKHSMAAQIENEKKEIYAQGTIVDTKGTVIPGATVMIEGTSLGAVSDVDGRFKLLLPNSTGIVLKISFVGMKTQRIPYRGEMLHVVLEEEHSDLDEVVVIGYGSTTKKDLTGAVSRFDSKIIEESTATNIAHMMQGQIPGLSIMAGDGSPGGAARLEIRGVPSLTGATSPLIVIDNVPMPRDFDINELNPSDVQNIDVLKGASSAAIYGSRGAAGVIMITTKRGMRNLEPQINYSYDYSLEQLTSDINVLTADEFKLLLLEGARNEAKAAGYDNIDDFSKYQKFVAPGFFGEANTPWMNLCLRDARKQQHRLSMRGGGKQYAYSASLGYVDETGIMIAKDFKRVTYDVSFDVDLNRWLTAKVKVSGTNSERLSNGGQVATAAQGRPDIKAFNDDGSLYRHSYIYAGQTKYYKNPIIELQENTTTANEDNLRLYGALDFQFLPSLRLLTSYSYNQRKGDSYQYASSRTDLGSGYGSGQKGYGKHSENKYLGSEIEARLVFNPELGDDHYLNGVFAATYTDEEEERWAIAMTDFPDDNTQNAIWQGTNPYKYGLFSYPQAFGSILLSYVARLEYKYKDRYLLTGSIRADGSSKFAPDNRWGRFPSLAAAWIVSEENFMKSSEFLTFLKFRVGWGVSGNGWVGEYGWRTLYSSADYLDQPATVPSQIGNDQLKWEETHQIDLGVDYGFFNNQRIRGSLGVYLKETDGLLYPFTMAPSTGKTSTKVNFASIENRGIEFDLTADVIRGNELNWSVGFNIGKNVNKITGLDAQFLSSPGSTYVGNTIIKEGESLGLIYGFETDGIFQNQAEINYYESLNPDYAYQEIYSYRKTIPGDVKFVDQNGDGRVDKTRNVYDDKVVLGCSRPDFEGGFNTRASWKGVTLSVQGTFSYGAEKIWTGEINQFNFSSYSPANVLDVAMKRWTPENPNNEYPCIRLDFYHNDFTDNSVYDASYVKIQNINLNYELPSRWVKKSNVFSSIDMYLSSNNVYTFTKYPGPSPESWSSNVISGASVDSGIYPTTRTYNFGVKVSIK